MKTDTQAPLLGAAHDEIAAMLAPAAPVLPAWRRNVGHDTGGKMGGEGDAGEASDAGIARSAEMVLEWMTSLPRDSVKVLVKAGWITLIGDVDWQYQRQAAARGVRHLMGVVGVSNHIDIKPKVSLSAVRADIDAALQRRAHGAVSARTSTIAVAVQGADVTLSGTVRDRCERELANRSAWGSDGVHEVVDNLKLAE